MLTTSPTLGIDTIIQHKRGCPYEQGLGGEAHSQPPGQTHLHPTVREGIYCQERLRRNTSSTPIVTQLEMVRKLQKAVG